ncbi:hypothetical protein ACWDTQ_16810 [Streptomyces cellulosae]
MSRVQVPSLTLTAEAGDLDEVAGFWRFRDKGGVRASPPAPVAPQDDARSTSSVASTI